VIVEAGGDYLWLAKDNQPHLQEDIALVCAPGFSLGPSDFQTIHHNAHPDHALNLPFRAPARL